jgi:hypothetical protein
MSRVAVTNQGETMGLDKELDSARSLGAGILLVAAAAVVSGAQCAPEELADDPALTKQGIDIGTGSITK